MHMTKAYSLNNETPNQTMFWSFTLAIISVFAIADVLTGGLVRESISTHKLEYGVITFSMIASLGVFAKLAPPGLKFVRACSRHKL